MPTDPGPAPDVEKTSPTFMPRGLFLRRPHLWPQPRGGGGAAGFYLFSTAMVALGTTVFSAFWSTGQYIWMRCPPVPNLVLENLRLRSKRTATNIIFHSVVWSPDFRTCSGFLLTGGLPALPRTTARGPFSCVRSIRRFPRSCCAMPWSRTLCG